MSTQYEEGVKIRKALLRWRRKALKALEHGELTVVTYRSKIVTPDVADAVRQGLTESKTPDDVKAAFQAVFKRFRLGVVVPVGADLPLPDITDMAEITEADIDRAIARHNQRSPEYAGLLDAVAENSETAE